MSTNVSRSRNILLALAVGLLTGLTACGGASSQGAAPAAITPTAAASVTPTDVVSAPPPGTHGSAPSTPGKAAPVGSAGKVMTSYAQLVDVWRTGKASYALTYDRVDFLTGKAAVAYYKKHPDQESRDWAVSNENTLLRQMPVASTASFYGNQLLGAGNGSATTRITGTRLVTQVKAHPRTLVKVSERARGNHREVIKIMEVYLP